jgi:hypothetical protein
MNNSIRFFSLFAPDSEQKYFRLNDNTINDLSIDFLANYVCILVSEYLSWKI